MGKFLYARFALAAAGMSALWACTAHPLTAPTPQPEQETDNVFKESMVKDLDVLFMIDNSHSMANKQDNLARNFRVLINELRKGASGLPNVHIGIVSSDFGAGLTRVGTCNPDTYGDRGRLQAQPRGTCRGLSDPNGHFIVATNAETTKNYDGDVADVFACMARLGTGGCGLEHQLQSIRGALSVDLNPDNAGFLRPDAYLALVLITDEDDCSVPPDSKFFQTVPPGINVNYMCYPPAASCRALPLPFVPFSIPFLECMPRLDGDGSLIPVTQFVDSIKALKDPSKIIVSAIAGIPQAGESGRYEAVQTDMGLNVAFTSCGANGGGTAPMRIQAFVDGFGENGLMSSICADDFTPAMQRIGQLIRQKIDGRCVDAALVDTDLNTPGVQPDCVVTETVQNGGVVAEQRVLPRCGSGQHPCWDLQLPGATQNQCRAGFQIDVQRTDPAVAGTVTVVKCATCADPDQVGCHRIVAKNPIASPAEGRGPLIRGANSGHLQTRSATRGAPVLGTRSRS